MTLSTAIQTGEQSSPTLAPATAVTSRGESLSPPAVKSAQRTVEVLEALARRGRGCTLSELQRELGAPKSSLYNVLRTLSDAGWVEAGGPGNTYRVGLKTLHLATSYFDHDPLVQAAGVLITQLRDELNETIHLARLDGPDIVYLATKESPHHMRTVSTLGRRLPAHATALGKAMLAAHTPEQVAELIHEPLEQLTPETVSTLPALAAELDEIRARGFAHEIGQTMPGLVCFAVAISGHVPATDAISCSLPRQRATEEHSNRIISGLVECASQLGQMVRSNSW